MRRTHPPPDPPARRSPPCPARCSRCGPWRWPSPSRRPRSPTPAPSPAGGPAPTCTPPPTRPGAPTARRPRRLAHRPHRVGRRVPLRRPPGRGGHRPLHLRRRLPQQPPARHRPPPRRRPASPPAPSSPSAAPPPSLLIPGAAVNGATPSVPAEFTTRTLEWPAGSARYRGGEHELAWMTSAATWGSPPHVGTGAPPTLFLSRLPGRTRRTRLPRLRHRDPGHLGTLLAMRTGTAGRHLGDPAATYWTGLLPLGGRPAPRFS